jgi:hypothetical protein
MSPVAMILEGLNYFGDVRMPQWWATVMIFRQKPSGRVDF